MELTTDVLLRGPIWANTIDKLAPIFKKRPNYDIFMLSMSIGIMYDQRIEKMDDDVDADGEKIEPRNVPRNVMQNANNENGNLEFMFQAAILSTKTVQFSEDERLELAFGDDNNFHKIAFLTEFANFGVTKLAELVGETTLETMENLKTFLNTTAEGYNFDINPFPDDIWEDEYET